MKKLILIAVLPLLIAGCASNPQISHQLLQNAVTLSEQVTLQTNPETEPYFRAAGPVVCAVANSTNANPAAVVAALSGVVTNQVAKIAINGSIALLNVAVSGISTNAAEVKLYVNDLCVGLENGLPQSGSAAVKMRTKVLNSPHLK